MRVLILMLCLLITGCTAHLISIPEISVPSFSQYHDYKAKHSAIVKAPNLRALGYLKI